LLSFTCHSFSSQPSTGLPVVAQHMLTNLILLLPLPPSIALFPSPPLFQDGRRHNILLSGDTWLAVVCDLEDISYIAAVRSR